MIAWSVTSVCHSSVTQGSKKSQQILAIDNFYIPSSDRVPNVWAFPWEMNKNLLTADNAPETDQITTQSFYGEPMSLVRSMCRTMGKGWFTGLWVTYKQWYCWRNVLFSYWKFFMYPQRRSGSHEPDRSIMSPILQGAHLGDHRFWEFRPQHCLSC